MDTDSAVAEALRVADTTTTREAPDSDNDDIDISLAALDIVRPPTGTNADIRIKNQP